MNFQQWLETYTGVTDPGVWVGIGVRIILIAVGFHLAVRAGNLLIDRAFDFTERRKTEDGELRRLATLRAVAKSVMRYTFDFLALTTVLPMIGIPVTQLLAGAGVAGLAIGFGAQNLIRDLIAGFFFLYENQFTVGDFVQVGSFAGTVEEVGMRVTRIRDFGGQLHILPNGGIGEVTNFSRGAMRAMVDVDIAYEENADAAIAILQQLCGELGEEHPEFVEGPTVLGVQALRDSSVTVRVWAKTENMQQWAMERVLLHEIKNRLVEEGVEIPYPRRVVVPPELTKLRADANGEGEMTDERAR